MKEIKSIECDNGPIKSQERISMYRQSMKESS